MPKGTLPLPLSGVALQRVKQVPNGTKLLIRTKTKTYPTILFLFLLYSSVMMMKKRGSRFDEDGGTRNNGSVGV